MEVFSHEITGNANLTAQQNNVSLTVFNFTGSGAISVDCLAVNKRALVLNLNLNLFSCISLFFYLTMLKCLQLYLMSIQCIRVRPCPGPM